MSLEAYCEKSVRGLQDVGERVVAMYREFENGGYVKIESSVLKEVLGSSGHEVSVLINSKIAKGKGILYEMIRSTRAKDSKTRWKVLIMDKLTMKIVSWACKMSDVTDQGVSLLEDIYKRRQPLPSMDAIYFMQPTKENVVMFLSDMSGRSPLYKKAYVFFSSPISKDLVNQIKSDTSIVPR
ncbi:hypothetical protein HPP92_013013 [Vanilla planifolia]|uniref:Uncharacterized protein n=1 Tax=Vanilla planifolia TaxID=51239 RepID=A0A835QYK9_VANPL|nr:hypothetical protein HPP92_013013 [Vanilla planifolia]